MNKPIHGLSEPTPKVATAARRLRPTQAAPVQRDPREDGCIDEQLGWMGPDYFGTGRTVFASSPGACSGTTGSLGWYCGSAVGCD
jgi:hypothetical protein